MLRLSGYSEAEKLQIARRYILSRTLDNAGVKPEQLVIDDAALAYVIRNFTREAEGYGVWLRGMGSDQYMTL